MACHTLVLGCLGSLPCSFYLSVDTGHATLQHSSFLPCCLCIASQQGVPHPGIYNTSHPPPVLSTYQPPHTPHTHAPSHSSLTHLPPLAGCAGPVAAGALRSHVVLPVLPGACAICTTQARVCVCVRVGGGVLWLSCRGEGWSGVYVYMGVLLLRRAPQNAGFP